MEETVCSVDAMSKVTDYKCLLVCIELLDEGLTQDEVDGMSWSKVKIR